MRRIAVLTMSSIFLTISAHAHQPVSIEATYDPKAKSLHVQVNHTSENRKEHYVRRMVISLNGQVIESKNLFFQKNNSYTDLDLPLDAKDADQITIQAFSEHGGVLEQSFKISDVLPKERSSTEKSTENSVKAPSKMGKASY